MLNKYFEGKLEGKRLRDHQINELNESYEVYKHDNIYRLITMFIFGTCCLLAALKDSNFMLIGVGISGFGFFIVSSVCEDSKKKLNSLIKYYKGE